MNESLSSLFNKASQLDQAERAALAGMLLDSLDPASDDNPEAVEAAWAAEIERRVRDIDHGQVETVSWESVRDRLDARGQARGRG